MAVAGPAVEVAAGAAVAGAGDGPSRFIRLRNLPLSREGAIGADYVGHRLLHVFARYAQLTKINAG
jgi:hypothetical protein